MPAVKDFIAIGKITKPIGIRGNLKVISLSDFPERFKKLREIKLFDEQRNEFVQNKNSDEFNFIVASCGIYASYINLKLEGIDDIEGASVLRDKILMIEESERVKLDEGRYYFFELIGCKMYDGDKYVGEVEEIVNYGSGDLFSIKTGEKEILIPFNENFVKNIDTEKKRIDVRLIEGFLE